MIRQARPSEQATVSELWKTCFGDDDRYIHFFMGRLFQPGRCLISVEDDRPVAMLHLLPLEYWQGGEISRAQYIYAAATATEYRRRGLMQRLIAYAVEQGRRDGCLFTTLLPASGPLYDYYSGCGFHTAFHIRRVTVDRGELESMTMGVAPAKETAPDAGVMLTQRRRYFQPALLWGRELFEYILAEWAFTGGQTLAADGGYCLYRETENGLFVKELCVPDGSFAGMAALLLQKTTCSRFQFHLPAGSTLLPGGVTMRYGMSTGAEPFDGAYFNLMLD